MSDTRKRMKKTPLWLAVLVALGVVFSSACRNDAVPPSSQTTVPIAQTTTPQQTSGPTTWVEGTEVAGVVFGQSYRTDEDVALYLELFEELPPNYLTKAEAYDLGWVPEEGNLWEVTDEMTIGGDRFGNREGLLPESRGRQYYEADVNYYGGRRNAERLVYSNDGLIYYTSDHYASYTKLYD